MTDYSELYDAILAGNAPRTEELARAFLAEGGDAQELIVTYMVPAMDEAGRRFETNEFFVPELLIAARAMKMAMAVLAPALAATGAEPVGKVVIGTVMGDMHDIGKNLVASMLEGAGFQVTDLGVNVSPQKFVETLQTQNGAILAMSALLTTTMPAMKATIEAVEAAGLRATTRIMIGGAPVTPDYATQIGADGYSENASTAVALARQLVGI